MAFSHCSTFGPKMKCWDSSTSATALSTSDLMVAYCALRSSNGTFIPDLLFQLPVRFGTDAQFGGQLSFLVKVEASKDAGLDLLVAVAWFRTIHNPIFIRRIETMPVPAHPSHFTCGV